MRPRTARWCLGCGVRPTDRRTLSVLRNSEGGLIQFDGWRWAGWAPCFRLK